MQAVRPNAVIASDEQCVAARFPLWPRRREHVVLYGYLMAILVRVATVALTQIVRGHWMNEQIVRRKLAHKGGASCKYLKVWVVIRIVKTAMLNGQCRVVHLAIINHVKRCTVVQLGEPTIGAGGSDAPGSVCHRENTRHARKPHHVIARDAMLHRRHARVHGLIARPRHGGQFAAHFVARGAACLHQVLQKAHVLGCAIIAQRIT